MTQRILALLIAFAVLASCKIDNRNTDTNLEVWIETSKRADTINFDSKTGWMILDRATEIRNGYKLPKIHAAPYEYEINGSNIALRSMLSSSTNKDIYYFSIDNQRKFMQIGNFFLEGVDRNIPLNFKRLN